MLVCADSARTKIKGGRKKKHTLNAMPAPLGVLAGLDHALDDSSRSPLHPPSDFPMGCPRWTRGAVRRRTGGSCSRRSLARIKGYEARRLGGKAKPLVHCLCVKE